MPTKTKHFTSAMANGPVLSGTAGALIAVLDAVLVNGFGLQAVSSIVVAGAIATVTTGSVHSHTLHSVALIDGALPAGLNGEKRVLSVTTNTFTFDATGVSDQTATGTITTKVAPAGWTKPFSGTNIAVYRGNTVTGTGMYLRVDDTSTLNATVRGYESMTDATTGYGPFPTTTQIAAGDYMVKSTVASAAVRPWTFFADDRGFFYFCKNGDTALEHKNHYFGDILSLKSNDPYGCVLRAYPAAPDTTTTLNPQSFAVSDANSSYTGGLYAPRAANALGGAVVLHNTPLLMAGLALNGSALGATGLMYPSQVDNGLQLGTVLIYNALGIRGSYPGLLVTNQNVGDTFSSNSLVLGTGTQAGKVYMAMRCDALAAGASRPVVFIDINSDWR